MKRIVNWQYNIGVNKTFKTLVFLLILIFFISFFTMPEQIYVGDSVAVRFATKNLITAGSPDVPADIAKNFGEPGQYFFENEAAHKWYPKYGIMNTFMYSPPMFFEKIINGKLGGNVRLEDPLYLNIYNILLSLVIAFFLYKIVSFYAKSEYVKAAYILLIFYSTFLWYYLRAQSFEIFQLLFFVIFIYFLFKFKNDGISNPKGNFLYHNLIYSELFLLFLCLTKIIFVLLIPAVFIYALLAENDFSGKGKNILSQFKENFLKKYKLYFLYIFLPMAIILMIIFLCNYYRFGSPFNTGYGQWNSRNDGIFSGNIFYGIYGFLFDGQRSIFIYFPILFFSIFGIKRFYKKNAADFVLLSAIFFVFLIIYGSVFNWKGEWSYGPRYLLFILPLLSLPFIETMHWCREKINKAGIKILIIVLLAASINSTIMQIRVNSLDFFTYYYLHGFFSNINFSNDKDGNSVIDARQKIDDYFHVFSFGKINKDFSAYIRNGSSYYPLDCLRPFIKKEDDLKKIRTILISLYKLNYKFF